MVVKISLRDCDLRSLLVTYLVQYCRICRCDMMYCMSILALHADSWRGVKLLIIPSLPAVVRVGSSSVSMAVLGCRGLG